MTGLALGFGPVTEQVGGRPTPERIGGALAGRETGEAVPRAAAPWLRGRGRRRRAVSPAPTPPGLPELPPQRVSRDSEEPLALTSGPC